MTHGEAGAVTRDKNSQRTVIRLISTPNQTGRRTVVKGHFHAPNTSLRHSLGANTPMRAHSMKPATAPRGGPRLESWLVAFGSDKFGPSPDVRFSPPSESVDRLSRRDHGILPLLWQRVGGAEKTPAPIQHRRLKRGNAS